MRVLHIPSRLVISRQPCLARRALLNSRKSLKPRPIHTSHNRGEIIYTN
ncbi:hypothetical protein LINGRAHAP2_LOCUS23931 [Linum grandiflorum]